MVSHVKRINPKQGKKGTKATKTRPIRASVIGIVISSMLHTAQSPLQRNMALRKERQQARRDALLNKPMAMRKQLPPQQLSPLQRRIAHKRREQEQCRQQPPPPQPQAHPVHQYPETHTSMRLMHKFPKLPLVTLRRLGSVVNLLQSMDHGAVFGGVNPYLYIMRVCTMTPDEFLREMAASFLSAGMYAEIRGLHDRIVRETFATTHDVVTCLTNDDFSSGPAIELCGSMACACKCNERYARDMLDWKALPLWTRQNSAIPRKACNCCAHHNHIEGDCEE